MSCVCGGGGGGYILVGYMHIELYLYIEMLFARQLEILMAIMDQLVCILIIVGRCDVSFFTLLYIKTILPGADYHGGFR